MVTKISRASRPDICPQKGVYFKVSGHSKWSQIKRQKGVADVKRGQTFTKLGKAITIAVREAGTDPTSNFKLRLAIDKAHSFNMPKENIQRAIDRVQGVGGAGEQLESVIYEGYGPGKVALIIEATTDNRNRTTAEVKNILEKSGASFVSPGTLTWMFKDAGLITVAKDSKSFEELFDLAVDAGASDVEDSGDAVEIYTKTSELDKVKNALQDKGLVIQNAELGRSATTTVEILDYVTQKRIFDLMERLESLDDVQKVWSNFDIEESLFA